MLTAGDEYPIHQTPEPIAYSGSDRNFYDRFFFNGYSADGNVFFAAALGVYPHLNVIDGAVSILKDGKQHSLHLSKCLNMERMNIEVGPMKVEILEPLNKIRLTLSETEGLALDATFTGRAFPIEEPRFTRRQGPRMLMDLTRMTQNGHWNGELSVDGETVEIKGFAGTRDRSWGVRPIGAADPQPLTPPLPPQFYWIWTPTNFENLSLFFHVNEDGAGEAWNTRSVLAMNGADHDGLLHLDAPKMKIDYAPASRRAVKGVLTVDDSQGRTHTVSYEPKATFLMKGIGYGHPEYRHGAYRGEQLAIAAETYKPEEAAWQDPTNLHIQAISKAVHQGPDGKTSEGVAAFEQLFLGPHAPSGWKDILDA